MQNPQDVQLVTTALQGLLPAAFTEHPEKVIGLVTGTGLDELPNALTRHPDSGSISFEQLPGYPKITGKPDACAFVYGYLNGCPVLAQGARFHLYDGFTPVEVCFGVRAMAMLGIKKLVLTNAAGSLNPLFPAGNLMLICDMINHTGQSALIGDNHAEWGVRFPDFSAVFDPDMNTQCARVALKAGIPLARGIYIGVHGPELETPAETRMYRSWGADAIGMSTVLEAATAKHMGMKILGLSCLTNQNLPDCMAPTTLEAIVEQARVCGNLLISLLEKLLPELSHSDNAPASVTFQADKTIKNLLEKDGDKMPKQS